MKRGALFWLGLVVGAFAALLFNRLNPIYPRGSIAYMVPRTLAPNTPSLISGSGNNEARSG